jgi:hypothetical protein
MSKGKNTKPPKNQIFASRYFKESIGSLEMKIFKLNNTSCKSNIITIGLLMYFLISALFPINNKIHIPVDIINRGSVGVDNVNAPMPISIDMGKLAIIK